MKLTANLLRVLLLAVLVSLGLIAAPQLLPSSSVVAVGSILTLVLSACCVFLLYKMWNLGGELEKELWLRLAFTDDPFLSNSFWLARPGIYSVLAYAGASAFVLSFGSAAAMTFWSKYGWRPFDIAEWDIIDALIFWFDQLLRGAVTNVLDVLSIGTLSRLDSKHVTSYTLLVWIGAFRLSVTVLVLGGILAALRLRKALKSSSQISQLRERLISNRRHALRRTVMRQSPDPSDNSEAAKLRRQLIEAYLTYDTESSALRDRFEMLNNDLRKKVIAAEGGKPSPITSIEVER